MPKFGKRSKERLRGIDARLVSVLNELVKIMDVTIIEGLRSEQRQEKLLKEGSTKYLLSGLKWHMMIQLNHFITHKYTHFRQV